MPSDRSAIAVSADALIDVGLRRQRRRTAGAAFVLALIFAAGLVALVPRLAGPAATAVAVLAFSLLVAGLVYVNLDRSLRLRRQAAERAGALGAANAALEDEVAERRQIQGELEARLAAAAEEHHQWMSALDAVPEAIFLHDTQFRLLRANRAYRQFAGLGDEALPDRPYWEVFPPLPGPLPGCARVVGENGPGTANDEFTLADGRAFISHSCYMAGDGTTAAYSIHILEDITERRAMDAKLRQYAQYDALTGLPNRVLFEDRFQQAWARAERHGGVLALLVLDLDRFKPVNDTYGHDAGDQLLKVIAQRLLGCARKTDTVVRFGGDEFAILLSEVSDRRTRELVAAKAAYVIEQIGKPVTVAGHEVAVGASIGIALSPVDGDSLRTMLLAADRAMYAVKQRGRDGYAFASESPAE